MNPQAGSIFLNRARYLLLTEYRTKLRLAVEALPEEAIWTRVNPQSNSVGNLLLHLCGNVRQWLITGVGGGPDVRQRSAEFAAKDGPKRAELMARLNQTLDEFERVFDTLTDESMVQQRTIQGREMTVLDAIFSCVEHFAQHLGQIILIAKVHSPQAIQFYEDAGGIARPVWKFH
jgi:uncharacterized damage-inducible protein DinB